MPPYKIIEDIALYYIVSNKNMINVISQTMYPTTQSIKKRLNSL